MRWFWQPPCLHHRVIVHLTHTDTEALQGVLWSFRWGWLLLRDVSGLTDQGGHTTAAKMDGEVAIHIRQVAYVQIVTTVDQGPR